MAFFDKVGSKAKELADSAKINLKISDEKRKLPDLMEQLGGIVWAKYDAGEIVDPDMCAICERIRCVHNSISSLNAELEQVKAAAENPPASAPASDGPTSNCSECGAVLNPNQMFCSVCGTKVVPPETVKSRFCASCGYELNDGQAFCPNCGTKS